MKGLYCRAGVGDAETKFVIQETVSVCLCLCRWMLFLLFLTDWHHCCWVSTDEMSQILTSFYIIGLHDKARLSRRTWSQMLTQLICFLQRLCSHFNVLNRLLWHFFVFSYKCHNVISFFMYLFIMVCAHLFIFLFNCYLLLVICIFVL